MIAKDEENNLSRSLGLVAGLFDEIVVVDTGSTDRTIEIARSFGARVFDFAWVDDFGTARNAALERATGDYAFWLDADDVVDPPEREKLTALLDRLRAGDEACYVVRCKCDPSPDGSGGETVVDHIRLFPLRDGIRWTYRVHEQILPALKRAGVPVRWTGINVRHTGYVDKALRARKLDREDAELWFRKAVVHRNRGESSEAERCWRRILTLHRPEQFSSVDQGIYGHLTRRNLAVLASECGQHAEAMRLWMEVLAECPGDREALKMLQRLRPVGSASEPLQE